MIGAKILARSGGGEDVLRSTFVVKDFNKMRRPTHFFLPSFSHTLVLLFLVVNYVSVIAIGMYIPLRVMFVVLLLRKVETI